MNKRWIIALLVIVTSIAGATSEEGLEAKVVAVVDGNTLEIKGEDGEVYTVVLAGIDSPELNQAFGNEAKTFLEKLILKKTIKVSMQGKDRWGNRLAVVTLKGNVDVRIELLKAGLAWTAERNPLPELESVRIQAQEKSKGLWKDVDNTAPWIFRRQQSLLQEKGS